MNRDIDDALAMDEPQIAAALLDELLATARVRAPAKVLGVLRARARLAFESAADDDLESLGAVVRAHEEAAAHHGAGALDHDALAWAHLMAGAAGRAQKAIDTGLRSASARDRRPLEVTHAAVRYAAKPADATYAALLATLDGLSKGRLAERLERVVRLLVQRQLHSGAELAERLVAAQKSARPLVEPRCRTCRRCARRGAARGW